MVRVLLGHKQAARTAGVGLILGGGLEGFFSIPTLKLNLKLKIASDGAKIMFYRGNVAIVFNMPQPSVRIGGGLHALIHIFFLHGGSKSAKPFWDLKADFGHF